MTKLIRHYCELIIFTFCISLFRLMGVDRAANFCELLFKTIGPYLSVSDVARGNFRKCLGYSQEQAELELVDLWRNHGRYVGEFAFAGNLPKSEIKKRVKMIGLENVSHLKSKNKPFILMMGHLANWDFLISGIDEIFHKWAVIYRQANNKLVDAKILAMREQSAAEMIPKGKAGVRDLLRAIKSKKSIAMLVDQKMNEGIEVPFFGRGAMTADAIAKLSLQYDYPIVPCQIVRKSEQGRLTSTFEVIIHPPMQAEDSSLPDSEKIYQIMLKVNTTLEEWIRQHPPQWFWFHNRWSK